MVLQRSSHHYPIIIGILEETNNTFKSVDNKQKLWRKNKLEL